MEEIKKSEDSKLEECKKTCDEYLNNWKRAAADLINYKKEEMERMAFLGNYAKENVILKILPVLDSFYLAQHRVPQEIKENGWMQGFLQIQNQIAEFLKQSGVEEIKATDQKFNPETMEIMEEAENGESGTVAEELQKGYIMNGKVIRPSRVKINK